MFPILGLSTKESHIQKARPVLFKFRGHTKFKRSRKANLPVCFSCFFFQNFQKQQGILEKDITVTPAESATGSDSTAGEWADRTANPGHGSASSNFLGESEYVVFEESQDEKLPPKVQRLRVTTRAEPHLVVSAKEVPGARLRRPSQCDKLHTTEDSVEADAWQESSTMPAHETAADEVDGLQTSRQTSGSLCEVDLSEPSKACSSSVSSLQNPDPMPNRSVESIEAVNRAIVG